jgi:hypothetical protein
MLYQLGQTAYFIDLDKHGAHLVKRAESKGKVSHNTVISFSNIHYLMERLPDFVAGSIKEAENNKQGTVQRMVSDYRAISEELLKLVKSPAYKEMKRVHTELMEAIRCSA